MGKVILVTGGSRSGKSAIALKLADEFTGGEKVFIATCPVLDDEMRARVGRHRRERQGLGWKTLEEETNLAAAISGSSVVGVILVDCLTLWVNNLMYQAEKNAAEINEEIIAERASEILAACQSIDATVIFVTNEVGMGIVPGDAATRLFRDFAGRCNQVIAGGANTVLLAVCGQSVTIKKEV